MNYRPAAGIVIALVLSALVDLLVHGRAGGPGEFWTKVPGFFALFGFLGCIVIVLGAKLLGRLGLQVDETYYDDHERAENGVSD